MKQQDHRRDDLFAPSEAGYTTDGTDFDFSDTDGSDIDLDSLPSIETAVEESAASIGGHSCSICPCHYVCMHLLWLVIKRKDCFAFTT